MFYILEASPERYIKKMSSTIVMLIRLLEGAVALSLLFRVAGYLSGLLHGTSAGVFELLVKLQSGQLLSGGQVSVLPSAVVEDQLAGIMPQGETLDSLLEELLHGSETGMRILTTPSTTDTIITGIAAAALLAVLAAVVVEAVAFVFLRFALKGSRVAKIAHKVIYAACIVLLLAGICLAAGFVNKCRMLGISSALLTGQFRMIVIMTVACMVLLALRVFYHRDVVKVLTAIDYEIHIGFKETTLEVKRLSTLALLFAVLALAGAVLLGLRTGFATTGVLVMIVLMVKYVMVYTCWGNFRQRHM